MKTRPVLILAMSAILLIACSLPSMAEPDNCNRSRDRAQNLRLKSVSSARQLVRDAGKSSRLTPRCNDTDRDCDRSDRLVEGKSRSQTLSRLGQLIKARRDKGQAES